MSDFIKDYYDLLTGEYKGINLTRITDFDEFKNKQITDSLEPYVQSEVFRKDLDDKKIMVDIGFGGGFPILPMANKLSDYRFYGVETRNKKVKVVGEIATKLGLKNVQLFHERIENILIDTKLVCTLKAVGKVNDFLSKINSTEEITVYFYKGPNFYEIEKDQLVKAKKKWDIVEEIEIKIPDVDKRYLVGFKNKSAPIGATNNKNLKKFSELMEK